ncbi:MAG: tRNA (adenosine(37)-N6)-dimethylallyltransferase MiaA [Planctomycetota bacterium]
MPPLLVLTGPTASGKSGAALPVARALDAEIVSLDSMLLYRGMNIGTDKPTDFGGVPHHLIDELDPTERFDARRYLDRADAVIEEIESRGRRALVVGGTALYLVSLLKGLFDGPPRDAALRAQLAEVEPTELHARLQEVDPESAARLHPNDRRRVTRALEVHALSGRPLSEWQRQWDAPDRRPSILAGLRLPRELLRARIEQRVDAMFEAGLVDEVRGLELGPTAGDAIGYKEVAGFLRGAYDEAEARRLIVRNTARLARRQETWFSRLDVQWVDARADDRVAQLLAIYRGSTSP